MTEQGYKNYDLTPKEQAGRAKSDMSTWRKKLQASKVTFDDTRKGIYRRKMQSARAAGVAASTVLDHYNNDKVFAEAVEEALKEWADEVHQLAWKLMQGVKKPIVGGKFKDEIITHELVHATNLLAMELKKTDPAYKERSEVDLNNKGGGVLLVPAGMKPEEFIKKEQERTGNMEEPGADIK